MATLEELEQQRLALDVQIAAAEKPPIEEALAFLNGSQTEEFIQAINALRPGISINSSSNALGGIVNSINMARTTLAQRLTSANMIISNADNQG